MVGVGALGGEGLVEPHHAALREQDPWLDRKVRRGGAVQLSNLPGRVGRGVSVATYRVAQRVVGFS
ncbi:hypothetical protein CSO01_31090 [Cellulomonas soli]|uniref:Uncharacterized protein n=1 Tax=Cellulomonas soli TaxID=931535 RepID=A0A512PGS0_9CELL|nr:hypothetical protein CSO01_31090 [Cellulomonas soli]